MNTHGRVWPNAEGINTPPNHFWYNCEVNELTTEQPMTHKVHNSIKEYKHVDTNIYKHEQMLNLMITQMKIL